MDPDRQQRAQEIFLGAEQLDSGKRAALLDERCAGDDELRAEVERLLEGKARPAVAAGISLGHYQVIGRLGAGGMGEVWEAADSKLDRNVALKVLPAEMATSRERLERFEREAKALAALDHPNIVTIYSVEEAGGVHFLTMGLVGGQTLGELIPATGMALEKLLEIAVSLAGAVAAAHEKGITHRDLKPSNVMVTDDGLVKVLDFGLAKVEERDILATALPTEGLTAEGTVLGTTAYMSPEQVEGKPLDHRSDIFSLGVVLYEMGTGVRPFQGDTSAGVMSSILRDQPPPVSEIRANLPRQLSRIIGQCLEKNSRDRFQTARDVYNGLKNLQKETGSDPSWSSSVPVPAAPSSGDQVPAVEAPSSKHTRSWLIGTALLAVAVALVWVGFLNDKPVDDDAAEIVSDQLSKPATDEPPMIAVLPFENMGPADDAYFAAGMTEEITARLASLSAISVIANTSARKYASTTKSAQEIGQELGADFLIMGSVRWARGADGSSQLRITPRLIKAADDVQIWADSYDRVFEDVFGIQTDIATKVVELLDVTLGESEQAGLDDRPTENMEAYDFYLKALSVPGHFANEEAIRERIALAERAVELDPEFRQAWTMLSTYESKLYGYGFERSEQQRQRAWDTQQRAIELNVDSPARIHNLYAYYYFHVERDYERALREGVRAIQLEPNNVWAQQGIGYALRRMGRFKEAVIEIAKAQRLDPRDDNLLSQLGSANSFLGNFEEAIVYYDEALEIDPNSAAVYQAKAQIFWRWKGDVAAARRILDTMPDEIRLGSADFHVQFEQLILEEKFTKALEFLDSLSVDAIGMSTFYRPISMLAGFTYELLGDTVKAQMSFEEATAHLEREVEAQPDHVKRVASLGIVYAALGRKEEAVKLGLRATEMVPLSREAYFGQSEVLDLAWIYTLVGEYDLAFDQLEILLSMPSWITVPLLRIEPRWASLRDQSRFEELERKYG